MSKVVKSEMILEGLNCAHCASKIECQVKEISGIDSANLDFVTKKLTISAVDQMTLEKIIAATKVIVKKLEPDVEINTYSNKTDKENPKFAFKKEMIQIALSTLFLLLPMLLPMPQLYDKVFYLISYVIIGGEIVIRAIKNICNGQIFDENFLMVIATFGAMIIGEYEEGVAVMLFYQVGELFQEMALHRSRKSIAALMNIRPDFARLKSGNTTVIIEPELVKIDDILVVKPGERIPLDGLVVEGHSTLDIAALTGESVPQEVNRNDEVLSGSINLSGLLSIRVTRVFENSTVSKILDLVENASSKKGKTEQFITKFAHYYTPMVVFSALAIGLIPPVFFGGNLYDWVYRGLIFLVVSCPCALVISIPLTYFGGIGAASKAGVLVKGSNYLEALNRVDTLVLDKTGTLTEGKFAVTKLLPAEGVDEMTLLRLAASAEYHTNHPIGQSVVKHFETYFPIKDIKVDSMCNRVEEHPGKGITAKIKLTEETDNFLAVGNDTLLSSVGISVPTQHFPGTHLHVGLDNHYMGTIIVDDQIKKESLKGIDKLRSLGVKHFIMLTGDRKVVAERVGRELNIDEVYSELLPHQKVEKLEGILADSNTYGRVGFVGDGINDAPVLARADIGFAMGGLGSDAAIEAADIVLMTDEITQISLGIHIAKSTRRIVWQNIVFALGVKAFVLILGALGYATMWEAVFADVGVALIAVLNAMRILHLRI